MKDLNIINRTKLIRIFQGNKSKVLCIDINFDNSQVATGSVNNQIKIWKLNSNNRPLRLNGHKGAVNCIKFDSSSKFLISGGEDGQINFWENSADSKSKTFKGHSASIRSLSFSIDNKFVISSSNDKIVKIWSINKKNMNLSFNTSIKCHNNWVLGANLSPDCNSICSIDTKNIKIWNTTKSEESFFYSEEEAGLTCIEYNKSGSNIAVGNKKGKLRLWDIRTSKLIQSYDLNLGITSIDFHPNDKLVGVSCNSKDGIIHFIDLIQGRTVLSLENLGGPIDNFKFSNDGFNFVFSSEKNLAQLWNIDIQNQAAKNDILIGGETKIKGNDKFGIINKNIENNNEPQENSEAFEKFSLKLEKFVSSINNLTKKIVNIDTRLTENEQRTDNLLQKAYSKQSSINNSNLHDPENIEQRNKYELISKVDEVLKQAETFGNNTNNVIKEIDNPELVSFKVSDMNYECVFDNVLGESLKKHEVSVNYEYTKN